MSVAGSDYDRLKRYNPAEIYNPSPKPAPAPKKDETKEGEVANAAPDQWAYPFTRGAFQV